MDKKVSISYAEALEISTILGKCTVKFLGVRLLLPLIKLKAKLSAAVKHYYQLREALYDESGLDFNADGSLRGATIDDVNQLSTAIRTLSEDSTGIEVESLKLFTEKHLEEFYVENPSLTTNELEVMMQLVAIEV